MRPARGVAWILLAVWASWLSAAQGVVVAKSWLGAWTPDLGLLLVLACAARFEPKDVPVAAVLVAVARCAHTVEPPAAVLAGMGAVTLVVLSVRRVAEVGRPLVRTAIAGGAALGLALWLALVHALRSGEPSPQAALAAALPAALATACSSALFGYLFTPSLALLPGLSALRRQPW